MALRLYNVTILKRALQPSCFCIYRSQGTSSTKGAKKPPEIPKNVLPEEHSAPQQSENGAIYDKKPFKMTIEAGKKYHWCLCGKSKNQPMCDGTHRDPFIKITQRPVKFMVAETKEYWLCNCKQTANRPFCDGTHKLQHIQDAIKW